jgi:nucleotide-binding universal stress UspA family protein
METTIVCGVDGSADSKAALAAAAQLANRLRARLVIAHVVEYVHAPYAMAGGLGPTAIPRATITATMVEQVRAGERLLEQMAEQSGLESAEQRVVSGFPAERLADLADEENAELIVVGSRGRDAFKAALLGSVSTSLIGVARCPVVVVPPGASES